MPAPFRCGDLRFLWTEMPFSNIVRALVRTAAVAHSDGGTLEQGVDQTRPFHYRRLDMCNILRTSIAALAALIAVSSVTASAEARLFSRRNADEQVTPPSLPSPSDGPMLTLSPADPNAYGVYTPGPVIYAGPVAPAYPTPCVSYRYAGLRSVKCCLPPMKTCLTVMDPCTCCPVSIPVCLPGCCCGEPCVSKRNGLFAKGIVTYDWACGVSVTVRFQRAGDVLVTYRGV